MTTTTMAQVATAPRPASRTSIRSPSPSTIPSSIPRPSSRSSNIADSLPTSPPSAFSPTDLTTPTRPSKSSRRRSSYETLAMLSATKDPNLDTQIPLPTRTPTGISAESIPEGQPLEIAVRSPGTPNADGRPLTPTRTLSRIPVAAVGNARALAEENGRPGSVSPLPPITPNTTASNGDTFEVGASASTLFPATPSSLNGYKRMSLGGSGGTTKVLGDLQNAAVHARNALDNTRQQLRLSQRSVAQLTRQVEDMKDGRERLRLENESLNNVVARKERLLQEVLERARKAEAEVTTLKAQLKAEATNNKKSVSTVQEAVTQNQKAQREYTTLRDSVAGMRDGWKNEVKELKAEMQKRDDAWREEVKEVTVKYNSLVKLVKATSTERSRIEASKTELMTVDSKFEKAMREEIKALTRQIEKSTEESDEAVKKTSELTLELQRLRRLMRTAGSSMSKLPTSP